MMANNYNEQTLEMFGSVATKPPNIETTYLLGANRADGARVDRLVEHFVMPEYPETSIDGVGHIVNLSNSNMDSAKELWRNVSQFKHHNEIFQSSNV